MLLDRDTELAAVRELVDGTASGGGRTLVIDGEAGIGKTGLIAAARRRADERGVRVLAARGAELEGDLAFGTVRELLGPVAAERPPDGAATLAAPALSAGSPQTGRDLAATLHGLYWMTADLAAAGPVLVLVDDAQWCDLGSLRFLAHLAGRLDGLPVSLLVASRPVTGGPRADLVAAMGARPGAVLRPGPLGDDAVRALIRARLGEPDGAFLDACRAATGGNPFLLTELLAELAGTEPVADSAARVAEVVPREVNRSVRLRLARLDPGTAAVARALAVLGDGQAPVSDEGRGGTVAALAGIGCDRIAAAVDELVAVRLLEPDDPARFRHPLLRAAVESTLGPSQLAASHRRAAAALTAAGAGDDAVLPHLMASTGAADADVVASLRRAAAAAVARGAPDTAATILHRALAEPPPPHLRAAVWLELGAAELRAGAPTAADHLASAADALPDPVTRARATLPLARALLHRGEVAEAVRRCERAADELDPGDCDLAFELEAELVTIASQSAATREVSVARHARRGADPSPDSRGACMLLAALGLEEVYTGGSRRRALTLAERSLAGGHLMREQFVARLLATGITLTLSGRPERAVALWDEAIDGLVQRGDAAGFALASAFRGYAAHHTGDLETALADARQALELSVGSPTQLITRGFAASWLTYALIDTGDLAEADALLTDETALFERGVSSVAYLHSARGRLRLAQGRFDDAVEDLRECGRLHAVLGAHGPAVCPWRAPLALALLGRGERDRARTLAAEAIARARSWGTTSPLAEALAAAGLAEGGPDGIALLEEAVEVACAVPLDRARAEVALGGALRRAGRRTEATRVLQSAVQPALAVGADGIAALARTELGAAGGRSRAAARPLTPTQRRVAGMAADGMTNRAIAQALFVSEKTVESHLSQAFRALGTTGRARLAEALRESADDV